MAASATNARTARLSGHLYAVVKGKRAVTKARDASLLIEAICDQPDRTACVERLVASDPACDGLRAGLRFDISDSFINNELQRLLSYLSDPLVKQLCNGDFLKRLLALTVDPPSLWNALVEAFGRGRLSSASEQTFAWLLLELLSWTSNAPLNTEKVAQQAVAAEVFTKSDNEDVRALGYRIKHVLQNKSVASSSVPVTSGPGGRHDNDFSDYRQISIYPTEHELVSREKPFYRRADAVDEADPDQRAGIHLDNQFRLLREDMLAELREDLKISQSKNGRRKNVRLRGLTLSGFHCGSEKRRQAFCITVNCKSGLERLTSLSQDARKPFLKEDRKFLKHQSFGCLLDDNHVVAFATLDRAEENLLRDPPAITLRIPDLRALERTLLALKLSKELDFVLVDTAMFAYEPVLQCLQAKVELPLAQELLCLDEGDSGMRYRPSQTYPPRIADYIEETEGKRLGDILNLPQPVDLDESQAASLLAGLRQNVSLIQGPPGTGKSFIGALLAKAFHDHTSQKILVICYTNHALDQFLEDLLDNNIPDTSMVRLGAQSQPRTEHLSLFNQSSNYRRTQDTWNVIRKLDDEVDNSEANLKALVASYVNFQVKKSEIMEYLEFSDEDSKFYDAFQLPENQDGFRIVGADGSAVDETYLYDRWRKGDDAGVFQTTIPPEHAHVWELSPTQRQAMNKRWTQGLLEERVSGISSLVKALDDSQRQLQSTLDKQKLEVLRAKRIIACTTTAAAKYTEQLQNAAPDIILVEEAGEILESHVLTAMTPQTKQLILIGDHQQLRPKVNNYGLTVEKGDGYDLNRSLFERLILADFPHTTLAAQHRMCPEISALVRHLTYPDLLDAPKTLKRPSLRGMQDRVVFFNHHHPEFVEEAIADRRDQGSGVSKKNVFEAEMVLQIVRYMAQQGYGTSDQVVLTPYLGQLSLLRRRLSEENDPVLNDLDSFDLVKAGLLSPATANQNKRRIRISTIDNYQGEESDIVIASLTRGNSAGDIGFMTSPERLNVLLSRARIGLIIIGNADTFQQSKKGKATWGPFMDYLSKKGHIYDGLPVKCQQHPGKKMVLKQKTDFDEHCPDGGCSAPCGAKLNCGLHACPSRCHQLSDHSKIKCNVVMSDTCPLKHKLSWRCFAGRPSFCRVCEDEAREKTRKLQRDLELEEKRQKKQRAYARELAEIQDELDHERRLRRDGAEQQERDRVLRQRRKELADLKQAGISQSTGTHSGTEPPVTSQVQPSRSHTTSSPAHTTPVSEKPVARRDSHQQKGKGPWTLPKSSAAQEWKDQKKFEGASNASLDELMGMVGLENVKDQFLSIKGKIDVAIRQNVDMKNERFGTALLGNPGTGKTTVARLYAKFLASVGALPGDFFVETTGSRLANDGVSACKKHIEDIMNNGGGAVFIDEAYQLVSGSGAGGSQVLDFLLAEVENLTGKIVFILAGYNKQMEAFFAHNPGIPSRFPREMQFKDYEDVELLAILKYGLNKRYGGRMKVELGIDGLYARVVARRVGRGRGHDGFGNARAVENAIATITDRQAKRLRRERKSGYTPDDLLLTREDLLGPEPANALKDNTSWKKLQELIGLSSVKDSIKALVDSIQYNYHRELDEEPLVDFTLNKVFLGNPGTGKTTVAKLYGQILADIGLLSTGEVVVKTPADFIGSVIGASEANTKGILASTVGKVLVIDEAYGLYGGNANSASPDPFKTSVIDTIVAEVQSVPGDDRCVLLLGYKEQMEEMFQHVNPGLTRRFPLDSAFTFDDFSTPELSSIFDLKLKQQGFAASPPTKQVVLDMLNRARNRPHFGNAGEIDILLNAAKLNHQKRLSKSVAAAPAARRSASFEPQDFDPDFDRAQHAATNVAQLFAGVVGCDDIVAQLRGYQTAAANARAFGLDATAAVPFAFVFRGPPGTGKTTTARRVGKVYQDMGFLATAEVVECSAADLVGEYVGHTGPKTRKLLERALGKVLFVDEAYRLADGRFAREAVDELVDCVTKPRFMGRLVVVLAGYDADMDRLMTVNPGLASRFPESVAFRALRPGECVELLARTLRAKATAGGGGGGGGKNGGGVVDVSVLDERPPSSPEPSSPSSSPPTTTAAAGQPLRERLLDLFAALAALPHWASARDVKTLAKNVFARTMRSGLVPGSAAAAPPRLVVDAACVVEEVERMVRERRNRAAAVMASPSSSAPNAGTSGFKHADMPVRTADRDAPPPLPTTTATTTASAVDTKAVQDKRSPPAAPADLQRKVVETRDAGVSDAVWEQLQRDKAKADAEEAEHRRLEERAEELRKEEEKEKEGGDDDSGDDDDGGEDDEEKAERERRRLAKVAEQRRRDEEMAKIQRAQEERRVEAKKQACLRKIGVCVAGFRWIKQSGGYRCAGGSHWVSDAEIEQHMR